MAAQFRLLAARFRPDLVHVQWVDDWAWRLGRALAAPLVLTAWGTDINQTRDPAFDPAARARIAEALKRCALLIGDSADLIEQAEALAGRRLRSLSLPIGIDTSFFRPGLEAEAADWRRRLEIPQDAPVILSPRALREIYGHHLIVAAFAELPRPPESFLVIKAYDCWDESYRRRILEMAAALGVAARLRIIDEVAYADLPALCATADLAVNFPVMDALPVTFLECLACGLPVVTNPLPAYASHDIASRLLFTDDRSVGALARRLTDALAQLPVHRAAAAEASAFICERFDATLTARTLLAAYRDLMPGAAGKRRDH
jgi:glycosyltransferase involved in cell wall biosynthesis